MTDFVDPSLAVKLEFLGRNVEAITEWSLDSAFLTSTDGFEFTAYNPDVSLLRDLELHPVTITLNGITQLQGRIDKTECGDDGTAVRFYGRDWFGDLVENNLDPVIKLKDAMTLEQAIIFCGINVGVYKVVADDDEPLRTLRTGRTINGAPAKENFREVKTSDNNAQPGQGSYDFINRLCARHGCVAKAGPRGIVVLTAPTYDQEPSYLLERSIEAPAGANNVKTASCTRDYSSFPTFVLYTGKAASKGGADAAKLAFKFNAEEYAEAVGPEMLASLRGKTHLARFKPGEVPPDLLQGVLYRLLWQRDDDAKTQQHVVHAATRAMGERLKETLSYRVTLRGHEDPRTGLLYAVDTIADVRDQVCGVNERLWIMSRKLSYSRTQGATTELELVRPWSIQL